MKKEDITIPGFIVSLIAGVLTIFLPMIVNLVGLGFLSTLLGQMLREVVILMVTGVLVMHYLCGLVMIVSGFLIKHEDHSLAGSILILVVSTITLVSFGGLFIGPILGIVGGIMGLKEHQRLMRT